MSFAVKISKNGEDRVKKYKWPVTTSSAQTQQEKVAEDMRKTFVVGGGSIADADGFDVDVFEKDITYEMLHFESAGKGKILILFSSDYSMSYHYIF